MDDTKQKHIFTKKLNAYVANSGKTQLEIAKSIGVSPQTFNTWCKGIAIPRMGKIQALADYFHINKSDLLEEKQKQDSIPAIMLHFNRLNDIGKQEATKRVEELTYISKYTDAPDPILNAAHELANSSVATRKHDDDIMDNDEEWK